jgi:hypothetical protein
MAEKTQSFAKRFNSLFTPTVLEIIIGALLGLIIALLTVQYGLY